MTGCPYHERRLPTDGTPLAPSPALATWRDEAPATPLRYPDGPDGLIVTRHTLARDVLSDPRFTVAVHRFPQPQEATDLDDLDEAGRVALAASNLLALDGEQHLRMRRAIISQFSMRAVRAREDAVAGIVTSQLAEFLARDQPADLFAHYATPISMRTHCLVLGVPDALAPRFGELFVTGTSTTQQKFDYIRDLLAEREGVPGDDVITHLLQGEWTRAEVEGILLVLMTSGRDSVAYLISTAMVALLTHPDQLAVLHDDPAAIPGAIEEFMRVGAMFVTLFPRTAREDLELRGVAIAAGTTVAVSPVAANHDERQYDDPDRFDVTRDAFGHLGFGHGPHGCVGQQLARLEIREAIARLLAAAPGIRLVHADQLSPLPFAHPVATYEAGAVEVAWR
ncbi:cytochrome P450 [Microbacterium yannicii]|uniref:Cytochrome P450 n=1 Tax=Microbacterium yannicii TaxID=671622 RepID=A0ABP9LXI0_9MICO|nr:cytochrome P450 [Microbacterium yannicii]MCO5954312.1 cytochrome P450 [Microbacterium yannicii]